MNMSKAALAPRAPINAPSDQQHPRWTQYQTYCSGMRMLLVECPRFVDWLAVEEANEYRDQWAKHPRYSEFLQWMRDTRGGARGALVFPSNFKAWLAGVRW